MAITNCTCYFSVTYAATPVSPNSPSSSPLPEDPRHPRQTRVILPKNKPQKWSTGVAPGEYGGPPTTSKLRKYWGEEEDPLVSDGFMWNKDFMGRMKKLIDKSDSSESLGSLPSEPSGFLNLNRVMSLDSMEIDLSEELSAPVKPVLEQQVEAARQGSSVTDGEDVSTIRWRLVPTRREQEKWDRAAKATTGGTDVILRESRKVRGDPLVLAAQAEEQYLKLKKKLQLLTLGIGGIGVFSSYVSYSPEIAASFGAGLLGSLAYIRMLGNSVDSMANGASGFAKGAVGQPRLLVPVVLVMVYNRWNQILVPDFGFMHLDLIPMLVGFFTYKIATFVQAVEDAITPLSGAEENKLFEVLMSRAATRAAGTGTRGRRLRSKSPLADDAGRRHWRDRTPRRPAVSRRRDLAPPVGRTEDTEVEKEWRLVEGRRRNKGGRKNFSQKLGECFFGESTMVVEEDAARRFVCVRVETGEKRSFIRIPSEIKDTFLSQLQLVMASKTYASRELWWEDSLYTFSVLRRSSWECKIAHFRARQVLARLYLPETGQDGSSPWHTLCTSFQSPKEQHSLVCAQDIPQSHVRNSSPSTGREVAGGTVPQQQPRTGLQALLAEKWNQRKKELEFGVVVKTDWGFDETEKLREWVQNRWDLPYRPTISFLGQGDWLICARDEEAKNKFLSWNHTEDIPSWDTRCWEETKETGPASVWLQIWGIPAELWGDDVIILLAEQFGTVVTIDEDTTNGKNMAFGRVLVKPSKWPLEEIWTELVLEEKCFAILLKPEKFVPPFRIVCKRLEVEDDESTRSDSEIEHGANGEAATQHNSGGNPGLQGNLEGSPLESGRLCKGDSDRVNSVRLNSDRVNSGELTRVDLGESNRTRPILNAEVEVSLGRWGDGQIEPLTQNQNMDQELGPFILAPQPDLIDQDPLISTGVMPFHLPTIAPQLPNLSPASICKPANEVCEANETPTPLAPQLTPPLQNSKTTPTSSYHDNFHLPNFNPRPAPFTPIRILNTPTTCYSRKKTPSPSPRLLLSAEKSPNSVNGHCNLALPNAGFDDGQNVEQNDAEDNIDDNDIVEVMIEEDCCEDWEDVARTEGSGKAKKNDKSSWTAQFRRMKKHMTKKEIQEMAPYTSKMEQVEIRAKETTQKGKRKVRGRGKSKGVDKTSEE